MRLIKTIGAVILLSLSYCVIDFLRKKSNFDSPFEMYQFYINIGTILGVIIIFVLVKLIIKKQFKIPLKNELKRFSWFDKLAFILVATGLNYYLEQLVAIFAKLNSNESSKNQQINNYKLEHNPLWYSLFDGTVNAPIIEEIMFRGIFYLFLFVVFGFWNKGRKRIVVYVLFLIISSVYFGYKHVAIGGDYQYIYPYIVSGLVFSVVFLITKSVLYSLSVHAIGNFLSLLNNAQEHGVSTVSGVIVSNIANIMLLYVVGYIVVKCFVHRHTIKEMYKEINN